jgi:hypothetical protein
LEATRRGPPLLLLKTFKTGFFLRVKNRVQVLKGNFEGVDFRLCRVFTSTGSGFSGVRSVGQGAKIQAGRFEFELGRGVMS